MNLYLIYDKEYNLTKGGWKMSDFIPKQYKSEAITIRIDYDKLSRIDHAAAVFKLSRSKFINQCIDYALEHMLFQNDPQVGVH